MIRTSHLAALLGVVLSFTACLGIAHADGSKGSTLPPFGWSLTSEPVPEGDLHPPVTAVPVVAPAPVEAPPQEAPAAPAPLMASMTDTPPKDELVRLVEETFPEDKRRAVKILACESTTGQNPAAYDHSENNAGPMQINRWWEPYMRENYGWTWDDLVSNVNINLQAARVVYDDAGGWTPWECFTSGQVK